MNERIRELERQAIEYANQQNTFDPRSEFSKKFAELIVRECAYLNFRSTGFVTSEGESMVRDMIKQHFGVEE